MAVVKDKEVREQPRDKEPREKEGQPNWFVRTYREIRSEMRKVVWPTREETARLTVLVVGVSAAASLFLALFDFLFGSLVSLLQQLVAR